MTKRNELIALADLRRANVTRQKEWDAFDQLTLAYRGNELAGEVGEACNVIKKLERERLGIAGSRDTVAHLADELADVIICTDLIAMQAGIDLSSAVIAKFNASSEKVGLKTRLSALEAPAAGDGEPVAIKPLEWDKHPDEDEWFSHDHGLYDVSEYLVYKSPVSTTAWCLKVRGILLDEDFLGPDAAKAAAQSDYEARIRSALYTHPASPPDVEAIRADERERCARIADDHTPRKHEATLAAHVTGARIASAIRTGGQK